MILARKASNLEGGLALDYIFYQTVCCSNGSTFHFPFKLSRFIFSTVIAMIIVIS